MENVSFKVVWRLRGSLMQQSAPIRPMRVLHVTHAAMKQRDSHSFCPLFPESVVNRHLRDKNHCWWMAENT